MTIPIPVPDGYVHRAELIERGWTSPMVNTHLPDFVKVAAPEGISNKAYPVDEVERVEREVAEVRKAVSARASVLPRAHAYEHETTVARSALIERGWTPAHIARLLGDPDLTEQGFRGDSYRYGRDRVETAEATDDGLRRRLEKARQGREDAKEARIKRVTADGTGVWRRAGDRWLVEGVDLVEGQTVTVKTRNGRSETKIVTAVVEAREDGRRLVEVGAAPAVRANRASVERPARPPRVFRADGSARTWRAVVIDAHRPGDVVQLPGSTEWVVVLSASRRTIDDDDPSLWGSHLLGAEGEPGTLLTVRAATDEESAPARGAAEARRSAEAAESARLRARQSAVDAVATYVEAHGTSPETVRGLDGVALFDDRSLYGTGRAVLADGRRVTLVLANGMDGDTWARNNYPGAMVTVCDAVPQDLIDRLRAAGEENG